MNEKNFGPKHHQTKTISHKVATHYLPTARGIPQGTPGSPRRDCIDTDTAPKGSPGYLRDPQEGFY